MTPDVNVVLLDFPTSGNEMVFENEDGSYTIMINSRLSCDGQLKAYRHAMHHIENDDFSKNDVQSIEAVAHEVVIPVEAQRIPSDRFLQRQKSIRAERKRLQQKLQQYEEDMKVIRSIAEYNKWNLSDQQLPEHQQWYSSNL